MMTPIRSVPDAVALIANYQSLSGNDEVTRFARSVVTRAAPNSANRAKAFLFCAMKLGSFGASIGLELVAEVLLHPAVIERFVLQTSSVTPSTLRTLRTNLRALARDVLAPRDPLPAALSRTRAKAPYTGEELSAYFLLARQQPTEARRAHTEGFLALGAGAGLTGTDLRLVRGHDVVRRSGGLVVAVKGTRARVVPVLAAYHDVLGASARFAGANYVVGGRDAQRHNVTGPLVSRLAGGADLARLEGSRLRATWLVACAQLIGLKAFFDAAGVAHSQLLGDLVATIGPVDEEEAVQLLGAACSTP